MSHTITITDPTAESGAPGDDTAPVVITVPESGTGPQERAATEPQAHQNGPDPSREVVDALKKCFPEKFMTKQQKRKRFYQKAGLILYIYCGSIGGFFLGGIFIGMFFFITGLVVTLFLFPEEVKPWYPHSAHHSYDDDTTSFNDSFASDPAFRDCPGNDYYISK